MWTVPSSIIAGDFKALSQQIDRELRKCISNLNDTINQISASRTCHPTAAEHTVPSAAHRQLTKAEHKTVIWVIKQFSIHLKGPSHSNQYAVRPHGYNKTG